MSRGSLEWAVDTALLESDSDEITEPHLRRTVILAMLDQAAKGSLAERLSHLVEFPSDTARRSALYRARRHLAANPAAAAIAERALRLAA